MACYRLATDGRTRYRQFKQSEIFEACQAELKMRPDIIRFRVKRHGWQYIVQAEIPHRVPTASRMPNFYTL